jgi:RepB DNA-primase from phage plasmid
MGEDSGKPDHEEARHMLDTCASVGARAVDLTVTGLDGAKEWFRRNMPLAELGRTLPAMLDDATAKKRNVIIRPHGLGIVFLQLDDLDSAKLDRVNDVAFLTIQTSPGNHQAWLAIPGDEDKDFARRVRKGTGADPGASGATRIAGSLNFKTKYAPDFPRVAIRTAAPGRKVTANELAQRELVAAKENFAQLPPARFESANLRQWPDYQYNLDRAKPNQTGDGLDLSGVDFVWCMTAATWGFSVADTAEMLLQVSEHARYPSNGKEYAERTAKNAAGYVERRRQQKQIKHWRG